MPTTVEPVKAAKFDGLGELVGVGRTSNVYAYGEASVVKVPHEDVPTDWPLFEAQLARGVHEAGLPVPEVHDVIEDDGRFMVVFERVDGPSMWQAMLDEPTAADRLIVDLVAIQRALFEASVPANIPDFVDRLARRITVVDSFTAIERTEAVGLAASLPRGVALLHGDLHPGNILMGPRGPIVIDWFDVAIGHPIADIVRTSILLRPGMHLPAASPDFLAQLRATYVHAFSAELEHAASELHDWQAAVAVGRIAEEAEDDEKLLVRLWQGRSASAR